MIAGCLTQVPLFNYLGYEFSAAFTIPVAFVSGIVTLIFLGDHLTKPLTAKTWILVVGDYFIINAVLLFIPFIVISFNALIVKNCSFEKGLLYFLLLPFCTMFFSISLALIVKLIFRRAIFIYCIIITFLLSHIVFITYTQPQLFAYNPILGYFPGITYDETIDVMETLLLYREFIIVASLLFIIVFFLFLQVYDPNLSFWKTIKKFQFRRKNRVLVLSAVICIMILVTGHFYRDFLGIEYSAEDIQKKLGRRTESEHFIFYYPATKISMEEVKLLRAEAEFHYTIVSERLEERVSPHRKISVYLYPDNETKQKFIGTSTTNIAKPWRSEIHLTIDSFEDTFRHELVHSLAGNFGIPVINASLRLGMNEGIATAVAWSFDSFSPHEYASALLREDGLQKISSLFTYTGFSSQQSSYAYTIVGSFSKYLIDRFGIIAYKKVFVSGNFFSVYGEPLDTLLNQWKEFLQTIENTPLSSETIHTIFFQRTIFQKTCARVTAERNAKAVQSLRVKEYSRAEENFTRSFEDAQTSFALRGIFQSFIAQKKYSEVLHQFDTIGHNSPFRYNPSILLLRGDAFLFLGKKDSAEKIYTRLVSMNYSIPFTEASLLRSRIAQASLIPVVDFQKYFYSGMDDSARISFLLTFEDSIKRYEHTLFNYLVAKEYLHQKKYSQAIQLLEAIYNPFDYRTFSFFVTKHLAETYYLNGQYEEAKINFWNLKNFTTSNSFLSQIDEWIERCDFVSSTLHSKE